MAMYCSYQNNQFHPAGVNNTKFDKKLAESQGDVFIYSLGYGSERCLPNN